MGEYGTQQYTEWRQDIDISLEGVPETIIFMVLAVDIKQSTGVAVADTKDEVQLTEWYAGYTANIKVSPTITLNLHRWAVHIYSYGGNIIQQLQLNTYTTINT